VLVEIKKEDNFVTIILPLLQLLDQIRDEPLAWRA
jgi:hypothetical protein